jgi:hypothetical protein
LSAVLSVMATISVGETGQLPGVVPLEESDDAMFTLNSAQPPLAALRSENELWSELTARFDAAKFVGTRVIILGCDTVERAFIRNCLRLFGVGATATASNVEQLASVAEMGQSFTHVIIDLDAYDCKEDAVDALFDFRRRAPEIVVVAVSSRVSGDDFGLERRAICDATLCLPLTERRLRRGLVEGHANNQEARRAAARDRKV